VGRHRKRRGRRVGRRIALVSAGLLIPVTGGAVVYAATDDAGRPAPGPPRDGSGSKHRAPEAGILRAPRPATAGPSVAASPSHHAPTAAPRPAVPAGPRIRFAPYADVLAWPPLNLTKIPGGGRDYTMGFVADGGGCSAEWGGLSPVSAAFALSRLKTVPGRVIVAFGGPHGTELAQSCDADALLKQYRAVLAATHPAGLDFYLSDAALTDTASVQRRTQVLARIERDGGPPVTITLPLHASGLSAAALGVLRSTTADGVPVAIVNLVPADGAGQSLIESATAAHGQLRHLFGGSDAQAWQRMGITPIIGVDSGAEFRPADAAQLVSWAAERGLGRLSMWSVTRDTPCTVDTSVTVDTCSGLDEDAGAFTKILQAF
jgi:hypothetical protein